MPEYRKLHHCFDMGERTSQINDFEFRVWRTYAAAADDFGVCPMLPGTLKGISRWLSRTKDDRPVVTDNALLKAMARLVEVGLCLKFQHQGLSYLCQRDWQEWEDIRYPKTTTKNPVPPPEVFGNLSESTQKLFREFHPILRKLPRTGAHETQTLTQTETRTSTQTVPETQTSRARGTNGRAPSVAGGTNLDWWTKHGSVHVAEFCDWMCFPNELAEQFANRLPGVPFETAQAQVLAWARDVRAQWVAEGRVPAGKMFDFWNARWQEAHGSSSASKGFDPLAGIKEAMRG